MAYDVALLIEQELSDADVAEIYGLHNSLGEPVRYHVMLPVADAGMNIEAGLASVGAGTGIPPAIPIPEIVEDDLMESCRSALGRTLRRMHGAGVDADGSPVLREPIAALVDKVASLGAREAVIMTRPHLVAEFFHVDWTHRAQRQLDVPVVHLLAHSA